MFLNLGHLFLAHVKQHSIAFSKHSWQKMALGSAPSMDPIVVNIHICNWANFANKQPSLGLDPNCCRMAPRRYACTSFVTK